MKYIQRQIKELYEKNKELSLEKSLLHCHVRGMHSIVLGKDGEDFIRIFVATPLHQLIGIGKGIAFHNHHCDLEFHHVSGIMYNHKLSLNVRPSSGGDFFDCFKFNSPITKEDKGSFVKYGDTSLWSMVKRDDFILQENDNFFHMDKKEVHSVTCPKGEFSVWLIKESNHDPEHQCLTYSTQDLTKWTDRGLYQKFDQQTLDEYVDFVVNLP